MAAARSLSGQTATAPHGPQGVRRSYSIANDSEQGPGLSLHIKAVDGGQLTRYWFEQARANDLLRLHGPLGTFVLHDLVGRTLVFLATGTGMAPVCAMLQALPALPAKEQPAAVHVYWGNRESRLFYCAPPEGDFHYQPVLSRSEAGWSGKRGHVQEALLADLPDLANSRIYACGNPAMIDSARNTCLAAGLPEEHFLADAFVPSGTNT